MIPLDRSLTREWIEPDGLGGFTSGTVGWVRTRRYHALLLPATTPPTGRMVLVDGFEAWVEDGSGTRQYLTAQHYAPDVLDAAGPHRIVDFRSEPWPTWTWRLDDGNDLRLELFVPNGTAAVALRWWLPSQRRTVRLVVRPFLSGRDLHALQRENDTFRFVPEVRGERLLWHPYEGVPGVESLSNGTWRPEAHWYRDFVLDEERGRGLDCVTDLAAPGTLEWDLSQGEAVWMLGARQDGETSPLGGDGARSTFTRLRAGEARRRRWFGSPLLRAADGYLVRRGSGKTIVAGYPWFTDWGRDTFIALRGLCLATGRLEDARRILLEWAGTVSEGMLPNRFVDQGDAPEFNSVDASLWYVVAVREYLEHAERHGGAYEEDRETLIEAVQAILRGYASGTRYGIGMDSDGLLLAGEAGVQLTWMDAKVGDWVVTPRIGKPVEIQALWINALDTGAAFDPAWLPARDRALASFRRRFWHPGGWLYDVVDVDRRPGVDDPSFRPNQILAVGGLPVPLLEGERARSVVEQVEQRLWTPLGLRSLDPSEPGYRGRYGGGVVERDGAYHQGTVWPWLLGPFVEAWVRVHGGDDAARRAARALFVAPLVAHLEDAGVGHVSEVADGDAPHVPGGCPFQAWSLGELLRLKEVVLAAPADAPVHAPRRAPRRRERRAAV